MKINLLTNEHLATSTVIANSTMNRERRCVGSNSYAKELGFNPIDFLRARSQSLASSTTVRWLDLCCGTGRALIEAAQSISQESPGLDGQITGIDLVDMFLPLPSALPRLKLQTVSVMAFEPTERYDLITCVHGLHYIGDKLGLIQKAVTWLQPDGRLLANLDSKNLKQIEAGQPSPTNSGLGILRDLKQNGLVYNARRHLLSCEGRRSIEWQYSYVGADDQAGANYTGQPVVDSYYQLEK
jgi:SAM-dependent methyltransferase